MTATSKTPVSRALLVAALILGMSAGLQWATPGYLDPDLARRLFGIMIGIVVIVYANVAPKTLTPLLALRCDPATEQSLRRFTATSVVLGGVGFVLAWMLAPIDSANLLAGVLLGTSVLAVGIRYAALFLRRKQR